MASAGTLATLLSTSLLLPTFYIEVASHFTIIRASSVPGKIEKKMTWGLLAIVLSSMFAFRHNWCRIWDRSAVHRAKSYSTNLVHLFIVYCGHVNVCPNWHHIKSLHLPPGSPISGSTHWFSPLLSGSIISSIQQCIWHSYEVLSSVWLVINVPQSPPVRPLSHLKFIRYVIL